MHPLNAAQRAAEDGAVAGHQHEQLLLAFRHGAEHIARDHRKRENLMREGDAIAADSLCEDFSLKRSPMFASYRDAAPPPSRRRRPVAVAQASHSVSKDGAETRELRSLQWLKA
jgi:hypothetical protein